MKISNDKFKIDDKSILNYYEIKSNKPKLLLLHAQGTNSLSFMSVINKLSTVFMIIAGELFFKEAIIINK